MKLRLEIGRKLLRSSVDRDGFLRRGWTRACLNDDGKIPSERERLKCPNCDQDFTCVGRHRRWCKGPSKGTSDDVSSINISLNANNANQDIPTSTARNNPTETITNDSHSDCDEHQASRCVCGKHCKGRRGLRNKDASKNVYSYKNNLELSSVNVPPVDQNINQQIDQPDDIDITNDSTESVDTDHTPPHPLPGVKLPKTKLQWEEANLFFSLNIDFTTPILDINVYAQNMQQTIYSYFASNYGTLKNSSTDTSKYNTMSIK